MVQGGANADFESIIEKSDSQSSQTMNALPTPSRKGQKRSYLLAFETLPAQMLNVYGRAKWADMDDESVWKHMCEPLKTGGEYMTEYCSMDPDRRGVAFNRFCLSMVPLQYIVFILFHFLSFCFLFLSDFTLFEFFLVFFVFFFFFLEVSG